MIIVVIIMIIITKGYSADRNCREDVINGSGWKMLGFFLEICETKHRECGKGNIKLLTLIRYV